MVPIKTLPSKALLAAILALLLLPGVAGAAIPVYGDPPLFRAPMLSGEAPQHRQSVSYSPCLSVSAPLECAPQRWRLPMKPPGPIRCVVLTIDPFDTDTPFYWTPCGPVAKPEQLWYLASGLGIFGRGDLPSLG